MSRSWRRRLADRLHEPVDGASLGAFRIVFGAMLAYEVVELWRLAPSVFLSPPFHFTYEGFGFVAPLPAGGFYATLAATLAAALAVTAGLFYRLSTVALFFGFGYLFLLEEAIYLNHFYLILLLAGLLTVLHANRWAALDSLIWPRARGSTVPLWNVLILRAQIFVVYFYGGLAKLNADWLRGEPLAEWLARRERFPFFGSLFTEPWVTLWFFSYGGLVFDLTIGFLLLSRRTRELALLPLLFFHVTNALVFRIGVFPWLMLGATVVFFDPAAPRRFVNDLRARWLRASHDEAPPTATPPSGGWRRRAATAFFVAWIGVQALVPLRHWLYPGDVSWTEEGHAFSWRMKLRDKQGWLTFAVTDRETGRTLPVTPMKGYAPQELQLTRVQLFRMAMCPRLIVQYAHYLHRNAHLLGMEDPIVRVVSLASLNGRPHQLLIDPAVDLAKLEAPWLRPAPWIVPLKPNQPIGLYQPLDLRRFDAVLSDRFPDNRFWSEHSSE